jgi:hypothetical protein
VRVRVRVRVRVMIELYAERGEREKDTERKGECLFYIFVVS